MLQILGAATAAIGAWYFFDQSYKWKKDSDEFKEFKDSQEYKDWLKRQSETKK